jgi:Tfp pilus assembly protein FimT
MGWEGVDWVHLAEWGQSWALVIAVMNLGFCKRLGTSWVAEQILAFQWGLLSMELIISRGRAIAQTVSFPPRRPCLSTGQVMWDSWWTKWHWGRFSPSTSVSTANYHSRDCSTHSLSTVAGTIGRISGRRTKWTQSHPTPRNKKN